MVWHTWLMTLPDMVYIAELVALWSHQETRFRLLYELPYKLINRRRYNRGLLAFSGWNGNIFSMKYSTEIVMGLSKKS